MNANVDYIIKTAIGEFNYLDYEGQHIMATNSIEGHARSAILSGQTLVNLVSSYAFHGDSLLYESRFYDKPIQSGETLTVFVVNPNISTIKVGLFNSSTGGWEREQAFDVSIIKKVVFTVPSGYISKYVGVVVDNPRDSTGFENGLVVVQGDQSHLEVNTYFEGMQSVKMPVLTTTGKNLITSDIEMGNIGSSNGIAFDSNNHIRSKDYIKMTPSSTVTLSNDKNYIGVIFEYDENYNFIRYITSSSSTTTATLSNNCKFIKFRTTDSSNAKDLTVLFQLEYGEQATSYEPFKSNILTVNEDVELRGIGDVRDTLDCLTGEVAERIGEIVLDGSENWSRQGVSQNNSDLGIYYSTNALPNTIFNTNNVLCDKFKTSKTKAWHSSEEDIYVSISTYGLKICFDERKLESATVGGFKKWLSENTPTIQYPLVEKPVKTVDLSDNHVYSYKDVTHYDCSSAEGSLVQTLSVKVPTDTQLTIQEQKATTQTLLIKNMDLQQSIKEVQAMNLAFNTALYNSFNSIREEVEDIKKHVSTNENLEGSF